MIISSIQFFWLYSCGSYYVIYFVLFNSVLSCLVCEFVLFDSVLLCLFSLFSPYKIISYSLTAICLLSALNSHNGVTSADSSSSLLLPVLPAGILHC